MNDIHGIQPPAAPKAIEPADAVPKSGPLPEPFKVSDTVEISAAARLAAKIQDVPEVRAELVQRVKTEIETGVYETPERVEIAVNRLMEELFPNL